MVLPIQEYLDYRDYLYAYVESRKLEKKTFSLRYFSGKVGLDHGNLAKVLQKKRHISHPGIQRIVDYLVFSEKDKEYWWALVRYNKAKSLLEKKPLFKELLLLKNSGNKQVVQEEYEYYQKWYHVAIYNLLDYYPFQGDYGRLIEELEPDISEEEAKDSIRLLEQLGLVKQNSEGVYKQVYQVLSTGEKWVSYTIEKFQEEMWKMSRWSLRCQPRSRRDMSTLTMSLNHKDIEKVQERIAQCRIDIINIVSQSDNADSLYQLNMHLFPFTKKLGGVG